MSITTVPVSVAVNDSAGAPVAGAAIVAKLSQPEVHLGYVVPVEVAAIADSNGNAVLNLWPNELGATQSVYQIKITDPRTNKTLRLNATIPNRPCALFEVAEVPPYPGKTDGQLVVVAGIETVTNLVEQAREEMANATAQASEQFNNLLEQGKAQAYTATAKASAAAISESAAAGSAAAAADSEGASARSAQAAGDSASSTAAAVATASDYRDQAIEARGTAIANAQTALTKAGEASTSAGAAATSLTNATTQANLAKDWATKTAAEVVAGQGYGAKKYANDAAGSATAAAGSATTASTKAGEAAGSATTATTKAGEAATSAGNAAGSATTASTKAGEASTSAGNAKTSETNAAASAKAAADSATAAATTVSTAITSAVNTAVAQTKQEIVNGAPGALDTLNELASALGNDANFAATTAAALGNRVRLDAAQGLTAGQQAQGRANLGMDQVTNTSDANKPVSTAQQAALDLKANKGSKADVGLGNVDNTSDANKPVSTAAQAALNTKANLSGAAFYGNVSTNVGEAFTVKHDYGYMSFYNGAGTVRTGFIQFNASGQSIISVDIAQALAFQVNGAERVRIDTAGNLMVGSTSVIDGSRLSVDGGGMVTRAGTVRAFLAPSAASGDVGTLSAHALRFLVGNGEVGRFAVGGALGIGTSAPDPGTRLHLTTPGGTPTTMRFQQAGIRDWYAGILGANNPSFGITDASKGVARLLIDDYGSVTVNTDNGLGLTINSLSSAAGYMSFCKGTVYAGYVGSGKALITGAADGDLAIRSDAAAIIFGNTAVERARIDNGGNFHVGITSGDAKITSHQPGQYANVRATGKNSGVVAPEFQLVRTSSATSIAAGPCIQFDDGNNNNSRMIQAGLGCLQFWGSNGGWVEHMRLDPLGNLQVGTVNSTAHAIRKGNAAGQLVLGVGPSGGDSHRFYAADTAGANAAACVYSLDKMNSTGRSINAAGYVSTSGADYAEYMLKKYGCGVIPKGAIVGIDADGELTDKFAEAISFMVKSTNPSYVGGDTWGTEEAIGMKRPVKPMFVHPEYTGSHAPEELPVVPGEPAADANLLEIADYKLALKNYQRDVDTFNAMVAQAEADHAAFAAQIVAEQAEFDTVVIPAYEAELQIFEDKLEAARQRVDRIAYCGQTPVNVYGAKPGQYVVPVPDGTGIAGILVDKKAMTLEQYMDSVGIVQNILKDGRANVRVKPV